MTAQVNLVLVWNYLRLHYSLRMWFYIPSCLLCRHGPFPLGTFSNWRFIDKWPQRHLFQKNEEGRGAVSQRFYFWRASWNEVSFWERFSLHMWGTNTVFLTEWQPTYLLAAPLPAQDQQALHTQLGSVKDGIPPNPEPHNMPQLFFVASCGELGWSWALKL